MKTSGCMHWGGLQSFAFFTESLCIPQACSFMQFHMAVRLKTWGKKRGLEFSAEPPVAHTTLGWQTSIIGGSCCHKYNFCCDKCFVMTNTCSLWQTHVCRNKTHLLLQQKYAFCEKTFVATKLCLLRQKFSHNKNMFVFVTTKHLSWQQWYLWQLPPMTENLHVVFRHNK